MWNNCGFPFWPMGRFFEASGEILAGLLAIGGIIFTVIMLIDCLKRPASKFAYPLTKGGKSDRLIWSIAMVVSLWFYFIGTIVYFFVVKQAKAEGGEKQ